jgi:hypothetical protein
MTGTLNIVEFGMTAEGQRPGNSPWQFTLLDFVEISAATAPCAWCLTWEQWEPTDKGWLLGLQLSSGLILFLLSRFLRIRGISYSLLFPFVFSQLFVLWLPGNIAQRFPDEVWRIHNHISQAASQRGQIASVSLAVIAALAILGGLTGHCIFKLLRRIVFSCLPGVRDQRTSRNRQRWNTACIFLELIPVATLLTWALIGYSMPRIEFHNEMGGALLKEGTVGPRASAMRQWTISKDSRRILMLDYEGQIHELNMDSGIKRVTSPIVAPRSIASFDDWAVHAVRECSDDQLAIFWSPSFDHSNVHCHIVDIETGQIADRLGDFDPLRVKGVSRSGRLVVTQAENAVLLGIDSLLVWDMETRAIRCELDSKALAGEAKEYFVILNDEGTHFAADIRREESQAGRAVTILNADAEPVLKLRNVECLGEFGNPPLAISPDGKLIWGRFAGLHDPLTNFHPVVERIISSDGKAMISAESEFGGMNLNETLSLDSNHGRVMKLKHSSEFDIAAWNGAAQLTGELTPILPLVGVQCFKQHARRRLRLCDASSDQEIAKSISIDHLSDPWFQQDQSGIDRCPYDFSPGAFQFSPDGQFAVFVPRGGYLGYAFDIWRLPRPKN